MPTIPADFFDSATKVEAAPERLATDIQELTETGAPQNNLPAEDAATSSEQTPEIPEGFFDDPKLDAKVSIFYC